MEIVTAQQMNRILEVSDSLSIHREAVVVPLGPEGTGSVRLSGNKIEITVPSEGDFETWIAGLPKQIARLDLSGVRKAEG